MGRRDRKGTTILLGILTAGDWDEASEQRSFILWTYDDQEYLVLFEEESPNPPPASLLPAKVEIKGIPGRDDKGRKTVTAKKYKLVNTEEKA